MTDPAGTLGGFAGKLSQNAAGIFRKPWTCLREAASAKAERNLLRVDHDRPFPLLDPTFREVPGYPSNFNKTRIPTRCLPAGRQGSVLGGAVQCNDEMKSHKLDRLLLFLPSYDLSNHKSLFARGVKPSQNVLTLFRFDDDNHPDPIVEGS
jgi:hypothetical protein